MKKHTIKNENYFSKIDNANKAYFLGYIAADGCIQYLTKKCKGLSITLSLKDKEVLDFFKKELDCSNPIYVYSRPQTYNKEVISNFCRLQITFPTIINDLESLGIVERKTFLLENILINIPKEYRKNFILGYFDGDGSFILPKGKNKKLKSGEIKFYPSYSIQIFIRGTKDLLSSFIDELELVKYCFNKYDSTFRLTINHKKEVIKFINIYKSSPFFLKRKYLKIQERLKIWENSLD